MTIAGLWRYGDWRRGHGLHCCSCTKFSPEFECQGQRSGSLGTKKNEKVQHFVFESSSGVRSFASSTPVGKLAHAVQFCFVLFSDRNACELLLFWRCDVCTQLLKVDEDQRVPSVEVSCEQMVDRLVQTSLTAANGQPVPLLLVFSCICFMFALILASECWQMPQWDRCPFFLESGGE